MAARREQRPPLSGRPGEEPDSWTPEVWREIQRRAAEALGAEPGTPAHLLTPAIYEVAAEYGWSRLEVVRAGCPLPVGLR